MRPAWRGAADIQARGKDAIARRHAADLRAVLTEASAAGVSTYGWSEEAHASELPALFDLEQRIEREADTWPPGAVFHEEPAGTKKSAASDGRFQVTPSGYIYVGDARRELAWADAYHLAYGYEDYGRNDTVWYLAIQRRGRQTSTKFWFDFQEQAQRAYVAATAFVARARVAARQPAAPSTPDQQAPAHATAPHDDTPAPRRAARTRRHARAPAGGGAHLLQGPLPPGLSFTAVDVETANAHLASICQIGVAHYTDGALTTHEAHLVNPQQEFDPVNVSIHGIRERDVAEAATFVQLAPHLRDQLAGRVVVCHTHFDRSALSQAFSAAGQAPPECHWIDTARIARRAWPEHFSARGYGLARVCAFLGYEFQHHRALEDAHAAATIFLAACRHATCDAHAWLERLRYKPSASIRRDGADDGPLSGEVVVFTGALSLVRREAADLAAQVGCDVEDGVTKRTTMLVVGDQDIDRLAGHEKSSKHRKAESLIARGAEIRILCESDFQAMVGLV